LVARAERGEGGVSRGQGRRDRPPLARSGFVGQARAWQQRVVVGHRG
jgi:hypothetical protein